MRNFTGEAAQSPPALMNSLSQNQTRYNLGHLRRFQPRYAIPKISVLYDPNAPGLRVRTGMNIQCINKMKLFIIVLPKLRPIGY